MAASDTGVPFSIIDGALVATDGAAASYTFDLVQAEVVWTVEREKWTEAMSRQKHLSTPTARKVGDGRVTGSMTLLVSSMKGSANETAYEVLTLTGTASTWVTTGAGDMKMIKLTLTGTNTTGATQSVAFNYAITSNVKIDPQGAEGLWSISFDFTDLENTPTIT